jgi:hypothetical protein
MKKIKRKYASRYQNPLWRPWLRIRQIVLNSRNPKYEPNRPVEGLDDFEYFASWVENDIGYKPGPEYKFSIVDPSLGWVPGNVKYDLSKNITLRACGRYFIKYRNKIRHITEVSEMTGIKYATLVSRINRGWTDKEVVRPR